ncbi:nuclear transport factor 2 family protein [Gryllotalpicola reticulitermitis]|uniref:Nuclear transport factor 2 family protein n=1 Tax=Gryllotalpicola reticulitermitis TaxID=1184153 RepID=A0ABV8QAN1_9MICO
MHAYFQRLNHVNRSPEDFERLIELFTADAVARIHHVGEAAGHAQLRALFHRFLTRTALHFTQAVRAQRERQVLVRWNGAGRTVAHALLLESGFHIVDVTEVGRIASLTSETDDHWPDTWRAEEEGDKYEHG